MKSEISLIKQQNSQKEKKIFEQIKMSQMGELIGNIAHQWRKPLCIISTAASGMKLKKEMGVLKDEDFISYSDSIIESSVYLSKTIDEFRDYIEFTNKKKEIIIQDRLKMAIALVESSYSLHNIQVIEGKIEKDKIPFKLILGELLQVLISILTNAKDALLENKIKDKWIKYELIKKEYSLQITIEDNAGGIKEEIIDKIFDSYFTTKDYEHGTGIGLCTSYDIVVNKLGGQLFVKNTQYGAKFYIELPLHIDYVI